MMVALGSCGFTVVAMELMSSIEAAQTNLTIDPAKIIGAIVGGIGFLGAGAIIQSGGAVRGLTTAAGLWVIASVGMAAGAGYYLAAVAITVLSFIILVVLRKFEQVTFKNVENKD
jgi:putative Mg2+ transporter-C (MgtC) family protein